MSTANIDQYRDHGDRTARRLLEVAEALMDLVQILRQQATERVTATDHAGSGVEVMAWTSKQCAAALGVSEKQLFNITAPRGTLPSFVVGERNRRYSPAAVREWIKQQESRE